MSILSFLRNLFIGKGKESVNDIKLQSIRLYSTGAKGKVYTTKFYKSINHNFGIEIVLKNNSNRTIKVQLGHCIYDSQGNIIFKGNFYPAVNPNSTFKQDIYVEAEAFEKMKVGKYKSQFWLNNTRVQKVYFSVIKK